MQNVYPVAAQPIENPEWITNDCNDTDLRALGKPRSGLGRARNAVDNTSYSESDGFGDRGAGVGSIVKSRSCRDQRVLSANRPVSSPEIRKYFLDFIVGCGLSAIDGRHRRINNSQFLLSRDIITALQFAFDLIDNGNELILRRFGPGLNAFEQCL